ncbi:MAG: hypothetical protein HEQ39_12715 [Rhizobacter sp.]
MLRSAQASVSRRHQVDEFDVEQLKFGLVNSQQPLRTVQQLLFNFKKEAGVVVLITSGRRGSQRPAHTLLSFGMVPADG